MTRQNISTGSSANDGTGDTLRSAGTKINANFTELYTFLGGNASTLSTQVSLEDSSIVFEGSTADAHETRIMAENATADRLVRIPNASGTLVIDTLSQTITNKTLGEISYQSSTLTANSSPQTADPSTTFIICARADGSAMTVNLAAGTTTGEIKVLTNQKAGKVTVTPSSFAQGTSFELDQHETAQCIWDGSNWLLMGTGATITIV